MAFSDPKKSWGDFRVGLITFFAICLLVAGITFAGGDKGLLFQKTVELHGLFKNVGGLKKGSSVSMAGMVIGRVTDLRFYDGHDSKRVEALMEVREDMRGKMREDASATVRTMGMLGDRYVDISEGTSETLLAPENPVLGQDISDFDSTLQESAQVLSEVKKLLSQVNKPEGNVGNLFYDERLYNQMTELTERLNDLIQDFKKNPKRYVKLSLI